MNERIQQLEKQCWETRQVTNDAHSWHTSFNTQKFAELIVKECIKHISDNMEYAKIDTADNKERFVEIFRVSGGFFINEIKEHFGVEE